jgi:FkbM family methyltransferase
MALIEKIFNPISTFHHKRISRHLKELDIEKIIDVGAHKGEFLEKMLKIEKVNSFYAFEPQKNIFNELSEKFSKNKKVTLYNFAMDKEITNKKLKINKLSMTSSLAEINEKSLYLKIKNFLTFSKSNFEDEYEIQTNTVDKIFENISLQKALLKIDVEGFEMNVIEGSQMKLKEIPFILLENQFGNHYKNNNFKNIINILSKQDFEIYKKFIFPTLHYQDILFKKK